MSHEDRIEANITIPRELQPYIEEALSNWLSDLAQNTIDYVEETDNESHDVRICVSVERVGRDGR